MTQAEIFQNMTKGEWYVVENVAVSAKGRQARFLYSSRDAAEDGKKMPHANCAAIVSAVNSTYGKGINPESVGEMRDLLEYLLEWADETRQLRIREALTASKL